MLGQIQELLYSSTGYIGVPSHSIHSYQGMQLLLHTRVLLWATRRNQQRRRRASAGV